MVLPNFITTPTMALRPLSPNTLEPISPQNASPGASPNPSPIPSQNETQEPLVGVIHELQPVSSSSQNDQNLNDQNQIQKGSDDTLDQLQTEDTR